MRCGLLLLPQALRHYGATPGPHQAQAAGLHQQLRRNLLANIVGQYSSTGYLWEQYDDATGALRPLRCEVLTAGRHAGVFIGCRLPISLSSSSTQILFARVQGKARGATLSPAGQHCWPSWQPTNEAGKLLPFPVPVQSCIVKTLHC